MAARNFLPKCIAFELQSFNDSIGIRSKNAVHLGKKFLATIFSAILYWQMVYYRLISVIAIFSRTLEKIVHDQIFEFLQPIFTKNQAAFRKLYSTITSLINSTDSWYSAMDRKEVSLVIFLDLKKAFNAVNDTILLAKLEKYGISGITGDWFT